MSAVAVAVSGGRDSMALLHCTVDAARDAGLTVWVLHVHHGLQPQADEWAAFVRRTCARWAAKGADLHFAMRRLEGRPARGQSVEAWARAGRYAALAEMAHEAGCPLVLLAHHQGDQAETFLLQALRGGGAAGLAAMPTLTLRHGLHWGRPWLDRPRAEIEAYVRSHRVRHVDDASNADPRFARNRLRLEVMPALREAFSDAEASLVAAARRAARERALIAEVARDDLATIMEEGGALLLSRWLALSPARRHEALRAWLAPLAAQGVPDSGLDRLVRELPSAAPATWPLGEVVLRRYRGRLTVERPDREPAASPWPCDAKLTRLGAHRVPGAPAQLRVRTLGEGGLPRDLLRGARWQARQGAERFQAGRGRPPRSLKKQFQAAGVPAWSRSAPLLVAADGALLFVPGLGIDARALAAPGHPRVSLEWVADP